MEQEGVLTAQPEKENVIILRALAILGMLLIIVMAVSTIKLDSSYPILKTAVQFDGTQFHVQNNDDFAWTDVRLTLNTDYKFNTPNVMPHSEYILDYSQFAKDDGTKFNQSWSPTDLYIVAQIPNNQWGSVIYKFQ